MPPELDTPEASDTIVVGGDVTDESLEESAVDMDSSDADNAVTEHDGKRPVTSDDEYSKEFDNSDSPDQEGSQEKEAGADVSQESATGETLNNSSASDPLLKKPSFLASVSDGHSSTTANDGLAPETPGQIGHSTLDAAAPPAPGDDSAETPAPVPETSPSIHTEAQPAAPEKAQAVTESAAVTVDAVDIQRLVDDIAGKAKAEPTLPAPPTPPASTQTTVASLTLSAPASLPPKPNFPAQKPSPKTRMPPSSALFHNSNSAPHAPGTSLPSAFGSLPMALPPGLQNGTAGAPGTTPNDAISSLPPLPPTSFHAPQRFASYPNAISMPGPSPGGPAGSLHTPAPTNAWDMFQADERRYLAEAKWEKFPDGSRIFIGNLSSERVSKRQVFDVFSKFGRLAQISLKNAYGFVQYHSVEDAQAAMQYAQGVELGGRKIHLEVSRTQKKGGDRERSPLGDRKNQNRGSRGGRGDHRGERSDRWDGRDQGRRNRDDYRPGRSPSPRRNDGRMSRDGPGWDRDFRPPGDRRGRSRSPARPGTMNAYRLRSPSPQRYQQHNATEDDLDIPRRYGADVPDVQLILMQQLQRDFVDWVQKAFIDRGLRTDVMYLNPRFPREAVIQRQIREGVSAIIELDVTSQASGQIAIQLFNRSGGANNVQFERYERLTPPVAAELVFQKRQMPAAPAPAPYPVPQGPGYPGQQPSYPPGAYGGYYPPGAPPGGNPYQQPYQPPVPSHQMPQGPAQGPDIAGLLGSLGGLDSNTLQQVLSAYQQNGASMQNSQIDINALLGSLNGGAGPSAATMPSAPNMGYPHPAGHGSNPATPTVPPGMGMHGNPGPDTAQQVQSIMDTLARFRQ